MKAVTKFEERVERRVRAVKTDGCITVGKVYVVKEVSVYFLVEDDHEQSLPYPAGYFQEVEEGRKPNHDVQGNSLSGQDVNYDLTSGDTFVIDGVKHLVTDTYPEEIFAVNLTTNVEGYWRYETLKRRWARYE